MKKINNKIRIAAIVFLSFIMMSSCKKYLEIPMPTNSVSTSTAFTSKSVIDGMMNQMYINLTNYLAAPSAMFPSLEALADDVYQPTANGGLLAYQTNDVTTSNNVMTNVISWSGLYRTIYLANLMLEGLPGANAVGFSDANKKQYMAAAKTVRAYANFMLVRCFGDVPLITSTDANENKVKSRNPKAEVYAQIEKDLKEAIADLPPALSARYFINNKFIPEAILANVYLTEGKWADAEAAADDIISSNKYQLSNVTDVFLQSSRETIMAVGYTTILNPVNSPKASFLAFQVFPAGPMKAVNEGTFPAFSSDFLNSFETGDLREANWIQLSNVAGYANPGNRMFCYKYKIDPVYQVGPVPPGKEEDTKFIRLAEVYLIGAEAKARQNKLTEAAGYLNMIRTRAGLPNTTAVTQSDMVTAVLNERRHELFFENGTRWFDLVRTGEADSVLSTISYKSANWKPYMVLFPIDEFTLAGNQNLTQNPGY